MNNSFFTFLTASIIFRTARRRTKNQCSMTLTGRLTNILPTIITFIYQKRTPSQRPLFSMLFPNHQHRMFPDFFLSRNLPSVRTKILTGKNIIRNLRVIAVQCMYRHCKRRLFTPCEHGNLFFHITKIIIHLISDDDRIILNLPF